MHQLVKLTDAIWLLQLAISSPLIHPLCDPSQAPTGFEPGSPDWEARLVYRSHPVPTKPCLYLPHCILTSILYCNAIFSPFQSKLYLLQRWYNRMSCHKNQWRISNCMFHSKNKKTQMKCFHIYWIKTH